MADAVQGEITITTDAIAQLAGLTAAGVLRSRRRVTKGGRPGCLMSRDKPEQGVEVVRTLDGLGITLRVVVEHGLNLAEVASTVRSHVGYEVSRLTGIPTTSVEVLIDDVRTST